MEWTALLVIAYFGLLWLTLRRRFRVLSGPWLFFLRAFFPNWKFYHGTGWAPRLWVRGRDAAGQWHGWQQVYPRLQRRPWHVLHNAEVNLALSQQNLVDHLSSDIQDLPEGADIRDKVSYQLVRRLARVALRGGHGGHGPMLATPLPDAQAFQFEVRLQWLGTARSEQALLSPVMTTWD
jgi:hypothetical protein